MSSIEEQVQAMNAAALAELRAKVPTPAFDFEHNPPAERVQAYLDELALRHERSGLVDGDHIHGFGLHSGELVLTASDLRDVLGQLARLTDDLDEIRDHLIGVRRLNTKGSDGRPRNLGIDLKVTEALKVITGG